MKRNFNQINLPAKNAAHPAAAVLPGSTDERVVTGTSVSTRILMQIAQDSRVSRIRKDLQRLYQNTESTLKLAIDVSNNVTCEGMHNVISEALLIDLHTSTRSVVDAAAQVLHSISHAKQELKLAEESLNRNTRAACLSRISKRINTLSIKCDSLRNETDKRRDVENMVEEKSTAWLAALLADEERRN